MNHLIHKGLSALLGMGLASTALALDCAQTLNQRELNQCAHQAFEAADRSLNQAYRTHRATLDAPRRAQLTQAQRAWLKFRDLSCQYEADFYAGGSMAPMVYSGCLTNQTQKRLKDLTDYQGYAN